MKHRFLVWLLSIVFSAATLSAQDAYMLKGVVQDEAGEPLIGATVMVKGTTQGVATDIDGNFAVNVKKGQTIESPMSDMMLRASRSTVRTTLP